MATVTVQNNDTLLETLATHIFEHHGPEIGNAAIDKNFILAYLKSKGKKITSGGLDFAEPVMIGENGNFGFIDHYSGIPANMQDPTREFKFEPKTYAGTLVLNKKHELQNKGKSMIKKWIRTLRTQGDTSISNQINDAMWKTSPGANDPESLISLFPTTNTTGTIGGINRSGNTWAQHKHDGSTVSDIGSEAGLTALHKFRMKLGGPASLKADFAMTTVSLYSSLMGFLDANRRFRASEQMTKLGFDNMFVGSVLFGYDGDGDANKCPADQIYFLNSNHLFFRILEGSDFVFEPFSRKDNSLNTTSIFYLMYNLTTNLPSSMGLMSAVTG